MQPSSPWHGAADPEQRHQNNIFRDPNFYEHRGLVFRGCMNVTNTKSEDDFVMKYLPGRDLYHIASDPGTAR